MGRHDLEIVDMVHDETNGAPNVIAGGIVSRRDLFRMFGAGIVMLIAGEAADAQESGGDRFRGGNAPQQLDAWLHIDSKGNVTVCTGKVEVGQNARTSLTQCVAEELRVHVGTVQIIMGDTALTPYDMGTFGSRTTPTMVPQLRRAAAAARGVIADLAAERWHVSRADLVLHDGRVAHAATSRSASYAELLQGQKFVQTIPADIDLSPTAEWKVMGTAVHKVGGRAFVTGQHRYTTDVRRDGMLYGRVLRPAAFNATLKSLDLSGARAAPGARVVQDGDFVGVVAPTSHAATRALDAIRATWESKPQPSSETLFGLLRPGAAASQEVVTGDQKDSHGVSPDSTNSGHRLKATYTVAYIAHAPLEPRAAIAEWSGDRLTVWTGTQRPFGVRSDLASALKLPQEQIRVIVPDTGSGYGGKHTAEAAIEAARLARAAGKPVKLVWTREEEFTWAYFRPAGVIEVDASISADGLLQRWEFDNYNSGPSGIRSPYDVADQRSDFHRADGPLREGSYRGLAATANHFARESHMDALARAASLDPLAFRLKNLKDERLRAVLEAAASGFGWEHRQARSGRGFGIAGGTEKGSYVANCAEVEIDPVTRAVSVIRIVAAFECGAIINPTHLQNQVEGATVMGMGGALFEAIRFDNGRILNAHFAKYRVPRFADVPPIDVILIDRKDLPSAGAGETPIVAIAPAIANALCDASGHRLCSLPLVPDGLKV